MRNHEILDYTLEQLRAKGIEKAQCKINHMNKKELNIEQNELKLLRTNINKTLLIKAIKDNKKVTARLNDLSESAIEKEIDKLLVSMESAPVDEAADIAPEASGQYEHGPVEANLEKMYEYLDDFQKTLSHKYPEISNDTTLSFDQITSIIKNTNGLLLKYNRGIYNVSTMFTAKKGEKMSSFNALASKTQKLEEPMVHLAQLEKLISQSVEQVETRPVERKFEGDVIITPYALYSFLEAYKSIALSDGSLISGTSILKDRLNEEVASELFTWRSEPLNEILESNYSVTSDGFIAENMPVIENGVLKNFFLSQYGANKTGMNRSKNYGNATIVDPGTDTYEEMIQSVNEGILFVRFSGGNPSSNGDFSGIAKNSYYIKDGQIQYPLNETMISGNIFDLMRKITNISKERLNFGNKILPWIKSTDVTISGK